MSAIFRLILFVSLIISGLQANAAAVIFQGQNVRALKSNLDLFGEAYILTGDDDPTSTAVDAPQGSLYLETDTGFVYNKLDDGSSTNWSRIGNMLGPISSTDNALTRWDGTTGRVLNDSNVILSDLDELTGVASITVDNINIDGNTISSTDSNGDIILDPDGTGGVQLPDLTADTVPYLDANQELTSSAVTPTELGYVSGVTSGIQSQIDDKLESTLTDGQVWVGDGTNEPQGRTLSGDISIDNTGVAAIGSGVIVDADVSASADLDRTKLAQGTADYVVINDASGEISEEQYLDKARGGAGADMSSVTFPTAGTLVTEAGTATLTNKSVDADSNTITNIDNDEIKAAAGIEVDKFEALTASRAVVTDGSGFMSASNVTSSEIDLLDGKTSIASKEDIPVINFWPDFQADTISNVEEDSDGPNYAGTPDASAANLSVSLETTNPLSGTNSYSLEKASGGDYSGQAWVFQADVPDRLSTVGNETLYLKFNYETDSNYDNDSSGNQISVSYYDGSSIQACNKNDILSGSFTNNIPVAPNGAMYVCKFFVSGASELDFIFEIEGSGTTATDLKVDRMIIGPDATVNSLFQRRQTLDFTGANAFTGGSAEVVRIGNLVTITETSLLTHSSASNPGTATNFLPDWAIPSITQNSQIGDSGLHEEISVDANGVYRRLYDTNRTTSGNIGSITYFVDDGQSQEVLSTTQANHRRMYAKAYLLGAQSLTSGTSFQTIDLDATSFDEFGIFDTANDSFLIKEPGLYRITGQITFQANATGNRSMYINAGGTLYIFHKTAVNGQSTDLNSSIEVELEEGDRVYLQGWQDSGGSLGLAGGQERLTWMTVEKIPDESTFSVYGPYEIVTAESSLFDMTTAGYVSAEWAQMTGNSVTLTPGTWILYGHTSFIDSGSNPTFEFVEMQWSLANGNNTATVPTDIGSIADFLPAYSDTVNRCIYNLGSYNLHSLDQCMAIITLTETDEIFLNNKVTFSAAGDGLIKSDILARRLK